MNLYQFKLLKEEEQYNTTWEMGKLIDARITHEHKFLLYLIDGFYVEIKYNTEANRIEGLKSFGSGSTVLFDYQNLN